MIEAYEKFRKVLDYKVIPSEWGGQTFLDALEEMDIAYYNAKNVHPDEETKALAAGILSQASRDYSDVEVSALKMAAYILDKGLDK